MTCFTRYLYKIPFRVGGLTGKLTIHSSQVCLILSGSCGIVATTADVWSECYNESLSACVITLCLSFPQMDATFSCPACAML